MNLEQIVEEYYSITRDIKTTLVEAKSCDDDSMRESLMETVNGLLDCRDRILDDLKSNYSQNGLLGLKDDLFEMESDIKKLLEDIKLSIEGELATLTKKLNATSKYKSVDIKP